MGQSGIPCIVLEFPFGARVSTAVSQDAALSKHFLPAPVSALGDSLSNLGTKTEVYPYSTSGPLKKVKKE